MRIIEPRAIMHELKVDVSIDQKANIRYDDKAELFIALICSGLLYFRDGSRIIAGIVSSVLPLPSLVVRGLLLFILLACFLRVIPTLINRKYWGELLPLFVLLSCIALSAVSHTGNFAQQSYYLELLVDFVFNAFPFYIAFRSVSISPSFSNVIDYVSVAFLFIEAVDLFAYGALEDETYSQYLAYQVLPACVLCCRSLFLRKRGASKVIFGASCLLGLVLLLSYGARGPILLFGAYFAFMVIASVKGGWKRIAVLFLFAGAAFMLILYYRPLLASISSLLESWGVSTRIIWTLEDGVFFTSDGRNEIFDVAVSIIGRSYLTGVGAGYDRVLISSQLHQPDPFGYYPHNIILELILHFGVVVGLLLVFALICFVLNAMRKASDVQRSYLIAFCCFGLGTLFISSSYLQWGSFYAFFALCASVMVPNDSRC